MSLNHRLTHYLNKKAFSVSLLICLLSACGQKGPLFLPSEKEPSSTLSGAETQRYQHSQQFGDD
ncbi:MAG: putative small lipoprotein YifL [Candidatus Azotimanducaceae bacterium]|jgi:predicted small lipoprotein YifL